MAKKTHLTSHNVWLCGKFGLYLHTFWDFHRFLWFLWEHHVFFREHVPRTSEKSKKKKKKKLTHSSQKTFFGLKWKSQWKWFTLKRLHGQTKHWAIHIVGCCVHELVILMNVRLLTCISRMSWLLQAEINVLLLLWCWEGSVEWHKNTNSR